MKSFLYLSFILFFLASCSGQNKKSIAENEDGIPVASMSDVGIDSVIVNKTDTAVKNGTYPNIHSLLVAKDNKLVYEKYWPGTDNSWGDDLGVVDHGKDVLHDIRSISKSIVSICIGIAIQQGKIKGVDQKVFEFFPEYQKADTGLKTALTLKHLLTMSTGMVWNEDVPYDHPENSEIRMIRSGNPIEFALTQPIDHTPGTQWKYNGGSTQILAAIIEKTTGRKIDQFAKEYLFEPLGITRFQWAKYPGTDLPAAASGLRLRSRDLMKFGLMCGNGGKWKDKQVVPAKWLDEAFHPQIERPNGGSYGYQFWLWNDGVKERMVPIVACVGNGEQRIFIDKSHQLVIVVTAGNYNKWDLKNNSDRLVSNFVYAAITK